MLDKKADRCASDDLNRGKITPEQFFRTKEEYAIKIREEMLDSKTTRVGFNYLTQIGQNRNKQDRMLV